MDSWNGLMQFLPRYAIRYFIREMYVCSSFVKYLYQFIWFSVQSMYLSSYPTARMHILIISVPTLIRITNQKCSRLCMSEINEGNVCYFCTVINNGNHLFSSLLSHFNIERQMCNVILRQHLVTKTWYNVKRHAFLH